MKDEISVRLDGINDKLDNMRQEWKDDIGGLKRGQTNMWKDLRKMNNRQTKTETRLERCDTLSNSGKDCPTTEKLKKHVKDREKEKEMDLTKISIIVGLVATGLTLVVSVTFKLFVG